MALTDVQSRDEEHERRHLAETVDLLTTELEHLTGSIDESIRNIDRRKKHMWTHLRDMDFAEKANFRESVNMSVALGEHAMMRRQRVERLLQSPYFGRVERHGQPPEVVACADQRDEEARILELIERHAQSGDWSLGIICKTVAQATRLYDVLSDAGAELTFLDYDSTAFTGGVVVTSAHIAKGLEFDAVLVPQVDEDNYANDMDRGMLYIACTRAMHELHLTHAGPVSPFLQFATRSEATETCDARVA